MGAKQSKEQSLYEFVVNHDIPSIQILSRQGANLEWKDKEGKTPLIVASQDGRLYEVAKTLIHLGANVNAFCKGHEKGTPLHYAAKSGLDHHVALLLSHGANPFVKNSKDQTPLDVARKNKCHAVVHEIEGHICYFAGEMKEIYGLGLSDESAPQLSSRLIWVVVVPRSLQNPPRRPSLELLIYTSAHHAEPRKIVSLKSCRINGPKFEQPVPALIIFDKHSKTRYKLTCATEGDKQQLRQLYNACKGISQVMAASAQTSPEPMESRGSIWIKAFHTKEAQTHNTVSQVSPAPSAPPMMSSDSRLSSSDSNLCVVCLKVPVEGACVPCGHVFGCMSCLNQVMTNNGFCPVCRSHVHQVIQLYAVSN